MEKKRKYPTNRRSAKLSHIRNRKEPKNHFWTGKIDADILEGRWNTQVYEACRALVQLVKDKYNIKLKYEDNDHVEDIISLLWEKSKNIKPGTERIMPYFFKIIYFALINKDKKQYGRFFPTDPNNMNEEDLLEFREFVGTPAPSGDLPLDNYTEIELYCRESGLEDPYHIAFIVTLYEISDMLAYAVLEERKILLDQLSKLFGIVYSEEPFTQSAVAAILTARVGTKQDKIKVKFLASQIIPVVEEFLAWKYPYVLDDNP